MDRKLHSWVPVLAVLAATFVLMALAAAPDLAFAPDNDVFAQRSDRIAHSEATRLATPLLLPALEIEQKIGIPVEELAAADALAAALLPVSLYEAKVQLRSAQATSARVSRVSLRLPYYAFGPSGHSRESR